MAVSPLVALKGAKPLNNATTTFLTIGCVSGTRGSITGKLISLADRSFLETRAVTLCNHGTPGLQNSCSTSKIQAKSNRCFINAAPRICRRGLIQSTAYHCATWSSRRVLVRCGKFSYSVKAAALDSNNQAEPLPRCIVLDIEGTTTPISFVFEVLFPYAHDNVGKHLSATFGTPETLHDIKLLRLQVEDDLEKGVPGAVPIPSDDAGKEKVIEALVTNVEEMIKADRKITALKQLQGHIWRTGFESDEIEAEVFADVPLALEKWNAAGIKVYIYSSGSRLAQRLIFGNTKYGDLRKYLSGFFDTAVGNKREAQSYVEISESLGVDKPSDVLFLTDVYQEAVAAKEAGLDVKISIRPGNGPLPENHGFKTINSFLEV